jgi:hypothetical protein
MSKKFLLDSNVFIQAKNLHYRFDFCEAFWLWIKQGHAGKILFSIDKVFQELKQGSKEDLVRKWALEMPPEFFLPDMKDGGVMKAYAKLIKWVHESDHYRDAAKKEFADSSNADAFLLAVAYNSGYTIVTHEKYNKDTQKKVPIPNIAKEFDIEYIDTFDLLSKHACDTFNFCA